MNPRFLRTSVAILPTKCNLCPRSCGVDRTRGERGVCGAGEHIRLARAALHRWEEPPISAGAGSGAVFFSYCPLHCVYCQNYEIACGDHGIDITPDRLRDIYGELRAQGACNINLVTPSHYWPLIEPTIRAAKNQGFELPFVCNTSGFESVQTIQDMQGFIDIYLTDFKYVADSEDAVGYPCTSLSSNAARRYSHAPQYATCALRALETMVNQVGDPCFDEWTDSQGHTSAHLHSGVVVRHLLLPDRLDESKSIISMLWHRFGSHVLYSVMNQYTPVRSVPSMPELNHTTSDDAYNNLLDYMDSLGMEDYYWQQGGTAQESFIPAFDCTGVLPKG
ncbi:MAG: radical SAM protein [Eggerthellaceae bacterium]|nr:radical SAM protein [Eggerthellaceae bacterium]